MRLKVMGEEESQGQPPLPQQLLRKYIAYASAHVFPVLSDEAKETLQQFYLRLRADSSPMGGTTVTARQLESLVRLAEARARCELREVVTQEDAEVGYTGTIFVFTDEDPNDNNPKSLTPCIAPVTDVNPSAILPVAM
jgi:DNA replicative helicase MCM subunit Mcm2 (Cdc46/Mcm family)